MASAAAQLSPAPVVEQLAEAMGTGDRERVIKIVKMLIREEQMKQVRSGLEKRKTSVLVDQKRAVDFQNSLMKPYRIDEPIMDLLKYGKLDCYVPSAVCFYLQRDDKSAHAAGEMMRKRLPCYLKNNKCYTDPSPSKKYESAYMDPKKTNVPVAFYCKTPVSLGKDRLGKDRLVDLNVLNVVALDSYIDRKSWGSPSEKNEIEHIFKLIEGATKQEYVRLHKKRLKEKTGGDAEPKREPRWWNLMMTAKSSSQSSEEKEKERERANKILWKQLEGGKCGEDKTEKIRTIYYFTNPHLLKNDEEKVKRASLIKTTADYNEFINSKYDESFDVLSRRKKPIAFKVNAYMAAWSTLSNDLLHEALFVFEWNGASAMGHGAPPSDPPLDPNIEFFNSIGSHSAIAFLAMSIRQKYVGVPP